jgi:ribosomal protein S18 acetylase RimI-like enzyme
MVTVRKWQEKDKETLVHLNTELQDFEHELRPSRRRGQEMSQEYTTSLLEQLTDSEEPGEIFVAELEGKVVGFVSCFLAKDSLETVQSEVMIEDLVVARTARGKGVGKALTEAVQTYALEHGITRVVVSVLHQNASALEFYKSVGFNLATLTLEHNLHAPEREAPKTNPVLILSHKTPRA